MAKYTLTIEAACDEAYIKRGISKQEAAKTKSILLRYTVRGKRVVGFSSEPQPVDLPAISQATSQQLLGLGCNVCVRVCVYAVLDYIRVIFDPSGVAERAGRADEAVEAGAGARDDTPDGAGPQ